MLRRNHGGPPERGGHCGEATPASWARSGVAVGPGAVRVEKGENTGAGVIAGGGEEPPDDSLESSVNVFLSSSF